MLTTAFEFTLVLVLAIVLMAIWGGYRAILLMWPFVLLLVPQWWNFGFGSLLVDCKTVLALLALLVLVFQGNPRSRPGFSICDFAIMLNILAHSISLLNNDTFRPLMLPNLLLHYMFYFVGRSYLRSTADIPRALSGVCAACLATYALAVVESLGHFNVWGFLTFAKARLLHNEVRHGLMRARVSMIHPIYLGNALVLMLPWVLVAGRWARSGRGPSWWRMTPKAAIPGLLATMSRGPLLAGIGTLYVERFFRWPKFRAVFVVATLSLGLLFQYFQTGYHWVAPRVFWRG